VVCYLVSATRSSGNDNPLLSLLGLLLGVGLFLLLRQIYRPGKKGKGIESSAQILELQREEMAAQNVPPLVIEKRSGTPFIKDPPKHILENFFADLKKFGIPNEYGDPINISELGEHLYRIRTAELLEESVWNDAAQILTKLPPEVAAEIKKEYPKNPVTKMVMDAVRRHLTGYFNFD